MGATKLSVWKALRPPTWKPNWAAIPPNRIGLLIVGIGLLILGALSACVSRETPAIAPTKPLVPATASDTPTPITPTATGPALAVPGEIGATASGPDLEPTNAASSAWQIDPVASELVVLAQRRVAAQLNLAPSAIQVQQVQAIVWPDTSLGCPNSGATYTAGQIGGYRIVLAVADQRYFFHTDFDRVMPCPAANEKLPTPSATPATATTAPSEAEG
jgi:hypothetical protein